MSLPSAHLTHHHQACVDAEADSHAETPLLLQVRIERPQRLDDRQSCMDSAQRVVFVRLGIAKIDEQPIAEILGDMPLKAGDHLGADLLIGPHHLAQVFRVELT